MLQRQEAFFFDEAAPPPPSGLTHTFNVIVGGNANTLGYNSGRFGSISSGSDTFTPPGGRERTIAMARWLTPSSFVLVFDDQNVPISEFPDRVVATYQSNAITFSKANSVRAIGAGTRMDLAAVGSPTIGDVFVSGRTIQIELEYD